MIYKIKRRYINKGTKQGNKKRRKGSLKSRIRIRIVLIRIRNTAIKSLFCKRRILIRVPNPDRSISWHSTCKLSDLDKEVSEMVLELRNVLVQVKQTSRKYTSFYRKLRNFTTIFLNSLKKLYKCLNSFYIYFLYLCPIVYLSQILTLCFISYLWQ